MISYNDLFSTMPPKYLPDLYDEIKDARWAGTFRTVWFTNDATTLQSGMKLGDTIAVVSKRAVSDTYRKSKSYAIAAEASMKLGNTGAAADYVNVVRKRAALPGKSEDMLVKASDMALDFMLDERAREFVGEQLRWFDLKRTGKLVERLTKYNPDAAPNVKPYHLIRPIPRVEIDVFQNKTEFVQNPGYN